MKLVRCSDQAPETPEEFYARLGAHPGFATSLGPNAMIELIAKLRACDDSREIFGLTSLYRLVLLPRDTWTTPWFVIVGALHANEYSIEYLMPERLAPWPGAQVTGTANSVGRALEMVLIAMDKSEGWATSR